MPEREVTIEEPSCGLRAFFVMDDTTLGPAAGGIRTKAYASDEEALADARRLARAMTIKCSLGGLNAGGAKLVVLDHEGLDRRAAFKKIGEFVESLGGEFRTAGDYGTTSADIAIMAEHTTWVHDFTHGLADAVARGTVLCMQAAAKHHGRESLAGLRVAVQGAGFIGAAVTRALVAEEVEVFVSDISEALVQAVAGSVGATVIEPAETLTADVDVVAPCAIGGVIDAVVADSIQAWAVCGAANNILKDDDAGQRLFDRDVIFVPDPLSSCGGVIAGVGSSDLIAELYYTTLDVLTRAKSEGRPTTPVAERLALRRIERARAHP